MKNEVIEYVMNSPGNTNRAVLESMLEAIIGGGSSENDLKIVTFDGNLDGKETFNGELLDISDVIYVKVLDSVIPIDEARDLVTTVIMGGEVAANKVPMEAISVSGDEVGTAWEIKSYPAPVMIAFRDDIPTDSGTIITAGTYVVYHKEATSGYVIYLSSVTYGKEGGSSCSKSNAMYKIISTPKEYGATFNFDGTNLKKVTEYIPLADSGIGVPVGWFFAVGKGFNDFNGTMFAASVNDGTFGAEEGVMWAVIDASAEQNIMLLGVSDDVADGVEVPEGGIYVNADLFDDSQMWAFFTTLNT